MKPKVSCVVATRSRGHLIKGTLMSMMHQTMPDWETIIIQNFSEDWTSFAIGTIADKRIRLHNIEEKGKSNAMNHAKKYIRGDYVCVFDDDDIMMPSKLEKNLQMMEETKADFGYSARYTHLINNQIIYTPTKPFTFEEFMEKPFIGFGSVIVTKDLYMDVDWDEKLFASLDFDWIAKCALKGIRMAYTDIPLYIWRNHLESITYKSNTLQKENYERAKERAINIYKKDKLKIKIEKWP